MFETYPLLFGLLAALSWGLYDYWSAKLAKKIGYQRAYFENSFSAAAILLIILLAGNQIVLPTGNSLAIVLFLSIVSFLGSLLVYKSFSIGKVSINSPISTLYMIVAIIGVAIITRSTMPLVKLGLAVATVLSSVLVAFHTLNLKEYKIEKGVIYSALAALCFTFTGTLPAVIKNQVHEPTFALIIIAVTAICVSIMNWKQIAKWSKHMSLIGVVVGLLYLLGWLFYFYGVNSANSVLAVAITGLFPVVPVILSAIRREEILQQHQKLALAAMFISLTAFLLL